MGQLLFTVFTPTYNRRKTLHRVYESLMAQTFRDFEWLIVDDGSTDETDLLVEAWKNDDKTWFPIRYLWQHNQHKKTAHNYAVNEAKGEFFIPFDSDDRCVPTALECFAHYWNNIPAIARKMFSGVCVLCMDEEGDIVGSPYPANKFIDSNILEMNYRYRISGEKWGFIRTDVLKEFPFPEQIPGLVPEDVVWSAIGRKYKTRFANDMLRIYCQDNEGDLDQLSRPGKPGINSTGAAYGKMRVLNDDISYAWYCPIHFLFEAARLSRFYWLMPTENRKFISYWPSSLLGRVFVILGLPLAVLMWQKDRLNFLRNP